MLEMKVYQDLRAYEPRTFAGMTNRQLAAVAIGAPVAIAVFVGTTYAVLVLNGWHYTGAVDLLLKPSAETSRLINTATNIALLPTILAFAPFAIAGWLRPKGMYPERYLPYVIRFYLRERTICYGHDHRDTRAAYRRTAKAPARRRIATIEAGDLPTRPRTKARAARRAGRHRHTNAPEAHARPEHPRRTRV